MLFNSTTFCILPWVHLTINPDGTIRTCCKTPSCIQDERGSMSIYNFSLQNIWNSQSMQNIRKSMLTGRPVAHCASCYSEEKVTGSSYRTRQNSLWLTDYPELRDTILKNSCSGITSMEQLSFQIIPGNMCNLKCRMCSTFYSLSIEKDPIHSRWSPPRLIGREGIVSSRFTDDRPWFEQPIFVDELLNNSIRKLYLTGGEPLIIPSVEYILDKLIEHGISKNISLQFNTNATKISESFLFKISQFKNVTIAISVDGQGACYEYMRYPARWDTVSNNILKLKQVKNINIVAIPIIQAYNILYIADLLEFLDSNNIRCSYDILIGPTQLSIWQLPQDIIDKSVLRLQKYLDVRMPETTKPAILSLLHRLKTGKSVYSPNVFYSFMLFTNDLDKSRNQNFVRTFPDFVILLKEAGIQWNPATRFYRQSLAPEYATTLQKAIKRLCGQEVYFWGMGDIYSRSKELFVHARPRCLLVDIEGGDLPDSVDGIPVKHPRDVLSPGNVLPIVIFVQNINAVYKTIREHYTAYTDLIFVPY